MNETLEIKKGNAIAAHSTATPDGQKLLENLFGKKVFCTNILDRVYDLPSLYEEAGVNAADYALPDNPTSEELYLNGCKILRLVGHVLNEGWIPNWNNSNEYKWAPWLKWNGAGFGFSDSHYDFTYTDAFVGPRFANEKTSDHAGTKFIHIYNQVLQNQNY